MTMRILLVTIAASLFLSACAGGGAKVGSGNHGARGGVYGTIFKF